MALDAAYFDAIHIDLVKKKYYNANKVHAVLEEIRRQAVVLEEENALLRRQLAEITTRRAEAGDIVLDAKDISERMVSEAQERAHTILSEAEQKRETAAQAILERKEAAEADILRMVSEIENHRRECMEAINTVWQEFLASLDEEPEQTAELSEPEQRTDEPEQRTDEPLPAEAEDETPADDVSRKVQSLAEVLRAIEHPEEEE